MVSPAYLAKLLGEQADMGVIYDCCGKPMAELSAKSLWNRAKFRF